MKWISILSLVLFAAVAGHAQSTNNCPQGLVCITPEAARAALEAGDKAKALQAEIDVLKTQTIPAYKDQIADWRIKYVEVFGRYDEIKQQRVEWLAEKELMLKLIRKKCLPLSVCIN
jgi:hypothetical protein